MGATFPHKRWRLGFSLGVALLMAALSFGLEFHHHNDGNTHDDCPLCVLFTLRRPPPLTPGRPEGLFRLVFRNSLRFPVKSLLHPR